MFHFLSQGTWRCCAYSLTDSLVGSERTAHRCLKQGQAANQKAASFLSWAPLRGIFAIISKSSPITFAMRLNVHPDGLATWTRFGSSHCLTPWTLGKKMQEPCHPFRANMEPIISPSNCQKTAIRAEKIDFALGPWGKACRGMQQVWRIRTSSWLKYHRHLLRSSLIMEVSKRVCKHSTVAVLGYLQSHLLHFHVLLVLSGHR